MASRAEEKAQARAQREAMERQARAAAQRRTRLMRLGGVVLVALIAVGIAIAVSSGGSKSKPKATDVNANRATIAAVSSELAGIPQSGTILGRSSAPVTVTYYGDLECPVCRDFTLGGLKDLIAKDVRAGKAKVVYRNFQTATQDPSVFKTQQTAALAAGRQNRAWQYIELFYNEQGQEGTPYVNEAYLTGLARQTPGLDVARWKTDRGSAALANQIASDTTRAGIAGINATPTIIIQGPKGAARPMSGAVPYSALQSAISSVS